MNNPNEYRNWVRARVVRPFTAVHTNAIVGADGVQTFERRLGFKAGQIVLLSEWRPEGMNARVFDDEAQTADGIFLFFRHFDNLECVERW